MFERVAAQRFRESPWCGKVPPSSYSWGLPQPDYPPPFFPYHLGTFGLCSRPGEEIGSYASEI